MSYILVIQSTYESIEAALYRGKQQINCLDQDKHNAGKLLISGLDLLFKKSGCLPEDLQAIGINCGPAPFTSLRILLATMNGLGCAKKIPLIALDGITLLLDEYANSDFDYSVAIFNAYNNDVHFGIKCRDTNTVKTGCMHIDLFCTYVQEVCNDRSVFFFGPGIDHFRSCIESIRNLDLHIDPLYPSKISLQYLHQETEKKMISDFTYQVLPLHLKELKRCIR
jgi:tRNA A37 threonylcarbamoyladenosine modification protein TsaB